MTRAEHPLAAGTLAAGTLVAGRYRIEGPLGQGGMGVVYRAAQLPMERPVALKMLRRELTEDPRARARFEREARVASALPHPDAVAIHDFGQHEGVAYLAMELVEGVGLRARLDASVSTLEAMELTRALADVLAAAHGAGLVHRDLKPENVIVDGPRVRVLDFGLAFLEGGPAGRMTREGVVVGTPAYLSPEQARGEAVGPATDVYALGCVLHELLTGRPPYGGADMDVLTKQMFAPPPPLRREALDVPAALDELRRAMLDKRADARPAAAEVRCRLDALDPDPARARSRAAQDGYLGPRAARMVGPVDPSAGASTSARSTREGTIEVGIVGHVDAHVLLGLSANGITAFTVSDAEPVSPDTAALVVPDASVDAIASWTRLGLPVVAGVDAADVAELATLLRAGAADVVTRPLVVAELVRKVRRVARDRARRG